VNRAQRRGKLVSLKGEVIPIKKTRVEFPERIKNQLLLLEQQKQMIQNQIGEKQTLVIKSFLEGKGYNADQTNVMLVPDFSACEISATEPPKDDPDQK
jgi:hypothetical protein